MDLAYTFGVEREAKIETDGKQGGSAVSLALPEPARASQPAPLPPSVTTLDSPAEWTGRLLRVCCYCQADMGTKPCLPSQDGETSHGICPDCFASGAWRK